MKYYFVPILIFMVACKDKVTAVSPTDSKLEVGVYKAMEHVRKSSPLNRRKALREFLTYANTVDGAISEEYGAFAFDYVENNTNDFFDVVTKNDSVIIADWARASAGEIEILAEDQKQKDSILNAIKINHGRKIPKNNTVSIETEKLYFKKLRNYPLQE